MKKIRRLIGLGMIALVLGIFHSNGETEAAVIIEEKIVGGFGFTILLKEDGTLWSWGKNDVGQLGLNNRIDTSQPTLISKTFFENERIISIEAEHYGGMAVTETNKVFVWGRTYGAKPVKIGQFPNLNDFTINGYDDPNNHSAWQLIDGGKLITGGSNYHSQYMNGLNRSGAINNCTGSYTNHMVGMQTMYTTNVEDCVNNTTFKKQVDGTQVPVLNAVKVDRPLGKIYGVFSNQLNEIYIGGYTFFYEPGITGIGEYKLPKKLLKNTDIIKEVYSEPFPMFLTTDNKLFAYTNLNQMPREVVLDSGEGIKDVQVGKRNAWILSDQNKVYGIGPNDKGQMGNLIPESGNIIDKTVTTNIVAINTGIINVKSIGYGAEHFPYIGNDNKVYLIGSNSTGQLGKVDDNSKTEFTPFVWSHPITAATFNIFTLVFGDANNDLYVAGGRDSTQRFDLVPDSTIPRKVFTTPEEIKEINGGNSAEFVMGTVRTVNKLFSYGHPSYLARGVNVGNYGISEVINGEGYVGDFNITDGEIGDFGGISLTNDNKVYSWGGDPYGSLGLNKIETYVNGNGDLTWFWKKSFQKVNIPDELNVKAVYAGPSWARLILTVEGDVYWFGRNNAASRVGGNSFASEDSCTMARVDCAPIKATTLSNIEKIAMGNAHTLFLDKNGKVFSVGNNGYGQLGNGTVTSNYRIIEVKDLPLIKEIGAGDFSSYAISVDGKVYSWGDNRYGQLGLKDLNQRNSPILTNITSGAKLVDGGTKNALIIKDDGQMLLTGSDEFGQLGLAQSPANNSPTELIFPPNLTFTTANNQIKEVGETIIISGDVFLSTTGKEVDITYTLENRNGKTTFPIKTFVSTETPEIYNHTLNITDQLDYGFYNLTVTAKETQTGVSSSKTIGFSILDKTPPNIAVSVNEQMKWGLYPVNVDVQITDNSGGSGVRGFQYAFTESTTRPTTEMSNEIQKATETLIINKSGSLYLHIVATDNETNEKYVRYGPYYMDIHPPDFVYTIPVTKQKDSYILPITIVEASNITIKKWAKGNRDKIYMESNGLDILSNLTISENGEYTLYAKDENNQETLEVFEITNVEYTPQMHRLKSKIIIPVLNKTNATIGVELSHKDTTDPLWLRVGVASLVLNSSNNVTGQRTNSNELYQMNFNSLENNTLYNGQFYLRDDQGIETTKVASQIEIYDDNFKTRSSIDGITLTWSESKLAEKYRVLKDNVVLYEGIEETYDDANVNLGQSYEYELQVFDGEEYITIKTSSTQPGISQLTTPAFIGFGMINLGVDKITKATIMDQEFIEYENNFQLQKSYEFRISATDLESQALNLIQSENIRIKQSNIKNKAGTILLTKNEIILSNTPVQVLHSDQLALKNYFKWELLKGNVEFHLPDKTKIQNGITEKYSGTIYTELVYGPN